MLNERQDKKYLLYSDFKLSGQNEDDLHYLIQTVIIKNFIRKYLVLGKVIMLLNLYLIRSSSDGRFVFLFNLYSIFSGK